MLSKIQMRKMKNGIKIIYYPKLDNNVTSTSVMCKVGSKDESKPCRGLSHFLEHMLFKKTENRRGSNEISDNLDYLGASFNAYTDKNMTSFIIKTNSEQAQESFDIISDMICNSLIDTEDVKMEKKIVIEENNMSKDNPNTFLLDKLFEIIFKNHPLGHNIGGYNKLIEKYKRDHVFDFYKKYYNSSNIIISVCSNLPFNSILNMLAKTHFVNLTPIIIQEIDTTQFSTQNGTIVQCYVKKMEQINLMIGFPVCGMKNKDKFALSVIEKILGGGLSSRLYTDLRIKNGLSYSISVNNLFYNNHGCFYISTGFDKNRLITKFEKKGKKKGKNKKIIGGLNLIIDNLKKIKNNLVSDKELNKAKNILINSILFEKEDSLEIADFLGKQILFKFKPIEDYDFIINKIKQVTKENILQIAKKYLNFKKMTIMTLGKNYLKEMNEFVKTM